MKEWLQETHGTRFELIRHFLLSLFDSELLLSYAPGAIAMAASSWMLLFALLLFKYKKLEGLGLAGRIPLESANDVLSLTAMAICLTGLLVAALWQSVYPTLRDYLALAALPISGADIFLSKFVALCIAIGIFIVVLPAPASLVVASVTAAKLLPTLAALTAASVVTFFGLIAIQGTLLNILPARLFERAMIWLQALLAAASLGGFFVAASKGHILLSGLEIGLREVLIAPAFALVMFALSFHRYRRLVVEAPVQRSARRLDWIAKFIRDPREQAALAFFWITVQRNRMHRLAILIYAALAIAWLAQSALSIASTTEIERVVFTVYPLALLLLTLFGIRHLFQIPTELRANWIFQITEREGRVAWMRAVERFVFACGVAPIVLLGTIFVSRQGGWWVAIAWAAVACGTAAIAFERLFADWRKLPFTCSYQPGKRPLILTCVLFSGLFPVLLILGKIVYSSATNPASLLIVLLAEIAVWQYLRRKRMAHWGIAPLRYVEHGESEIDRFDLAGEGTVIAQEEFQREWGDFVRNEPASPIFRPLEAGETHLQRVLEWLRALPQDLLYALRVLRKSPGFVAAVVFTLGLGLGLNGAFFTIFNAYLLRPLAVRDPASLVSIEFKTQYRTDAYLNWQEFEALAAAAPAFTSVAASSLQGSGLEGQSSRIAVVSSNFFELLGVNAAYGRVFRAGDDDASLVLNYRTWQSRFGGDPALVGKKVMLNGTLFEVAGIAEPEFAGVAVGTVEMVPPRYAKFGVAAPDCWVVQSAWNRAPGITPSPVRGIVGRLRPEMTESRAKSIVTGHVRRATSARSQYDRIRYAEFETLSIPITWTAITFSLPLLIAFGLTMLIPCANAANILLARATARQREFGTRISLGASRGRVVRQLLAEGLVLALLAAAAGVGIAKFSLNVLLHFLFATAPPTLLHRARIPDFTIDSYVWVYMALVAAVTTILFAVAPAAQTTRLSITSALRGEFGGLQGSGLRDALVVGQVSLCVMLLATSGLLLRGTRKAVNIERGYDMTSVFGVGNESVADSEALAAILRDEPWVDTYAVMGRPMTEGKAIELGAAGGPGRLSAYFFQCSGDFFQMVRLPIVRGRTFTQEEGDRELPVAIVSELTARGLWPGQDPIGKTISVLSIAETAWPKLRFAEALVVGVSRDFVVKARDGGQRPTIHFPNKLRPGAVPAVRGKHGPEQTRKHLAAALARSPGAQHGAWVVAMQETIDWESYPQQAVSWLATLLGGVALLLTITGIYGTMSYLVSQRFKEIGIRMALGASAMQITRFVVFYTARLAAIGLIFGLILAIGVLQYLGSRMELLVNLLDTSAYGLTLVVALLAALVAAFAPARRACRIDPQTALRLE
ncbi:MAG: ABC transporter permease [Acidobacteria bacterium]|nr:ABC transporter permease [Acidobacteriota bacterium]